MGWRQTLKKALNELELEKSRLNSELREIGSQIEKLRRMTGPDGTGRGRPAGTKKPKTKRVLSPKGRASISRAAKARWARVRAAQQKTGKR